MHTRLQNHRSYPAELGSYPAELGTGIGNQQHAHPYSWPAQVVSCKMSFMLLLLLLLLLLLQGCA
jgi:hypothetical protein